MAELRHFTTIENGPRAKALIEFSDKHGGVIQVRVTVNMDIAASEASLFGGYMDEVKRLLNYGQSHKVNT